MKKAISLLAFICVLLASVATVSASAMGSTSVWGDVNEDELVNMKDVLALRQHVAGITLFADESLGDLDFDNAVNMKDVLALRKYIAGLIDAPTMPQTTATAAEPTVTATEPELTATQPAPQGEPYRYGEDGVPYMSFTEGVDDASVSVWWWQTGDAENETTRTKYLDFLKKNGTTDIYYYCVYDMTKAAGRTSTHKFVEAAAEYGIRVVPLYDDVGMINGVERCDVRVSQMLSMFKAYHESYPDDVMDMIHFDVEPHQVFADKNIKHLTAKELDLYAQNFIGGIQVLREAGIKVEAALNCTWNNYGGETVEWNGAKGIYNICAKGLDSMCLMAYRDTAEDIMELAKPGFDAAMEYGTRISYGIETGHYSFNKVEEEFAQETMEYMYTEFAKVFEALRENHPAGGYGIAVHNHRTWMTMKKEGQPA